MKNAMQTMMKPLLLALCGALLFGAAQAAWNQEARPHDGKQKTNASTLRVGGSGEMQAAPDRATIRMGAQAQGANATSAQGKVNLVFGKALKRIRALGIESKRIRTEDLSLHPIYKPQRYSDNRPPRIIGYRASEVLVVEVEKLILVGRVIDAGLTSGVNKIEGVSFDLRDENAARAEALENAGTQAKKKAESLARSLGMRLDGVVEASEGNVSLTPPPMYDEAAMTGVSTRMRAKTSIQPGEINVSASVTIRYSLAPL